MGRGRQPLPQPVYPEQVYAALPSIAGLAGVSPRAIEGWVREGRLVPLVTLEPNIPRKIIRLYRLSEVLALKASRKG